MKQETGRNCNIKNRTFKRSTQKEKLRSFESET